METTQTEAEIVTEMLHNLYQGDLSRSSDYLAEDATLTYIATNQVFQGRAAVIAAFQELRAEFPDLQNQIVDVLSCGDKVGAEIVVRGSHRDEFLSSRFGPLPPTGKRFTLPAFLVCSFEQGRITKIVQFHDTATLASQLGLGAPNPVLGRHLGDLPGFPRHDEAQAQRG